MKLEQQVTSLELSKRLKELGVGQEHDSLFWWHHIVYKDDSEEFAIKNSFILRGDLSIKSAEMIAVAFTVAELGEMLPERFDYKTSSQEKSGYDGTRPLYFTSGRTIIEKGGWYIMYSDPHPANKIPVYAQHADTEANARAKMLIYLLENNLLIN